MRVARDADGTFHPTLILLGTRLGIDRVTPVYWDAVKATLCLPQSIGIAGYVSPCLSFNLSADSNPQVVAPLHLITSSAPSPHTSSTSIRTLLVLSSLLHLQMQT